MSNSPIARIFHFHEREKSRLRGVDDGRIYFSGNFRNTYREFSSRTFDGFFRGTTFLTWPWDRKKTEFLYGERKLIFPGEEFFTRAVFRLRPADDNKHSNI